MADMQALNRGSEKFPGRFSQMVMDLPFLLPPCKENRLKSQVQDGGERNTDLTASCRGLGKCGKAFEHMQNID